MADLSRNQRLMLESLQRCESYLSACAEVGVSRVTLWRWFKQPAFHEAYLEIRFQAQQEATTLAQKSLTRVVQTWCRILDNPHASPMPRIKAGSEIANFALKSREQEELQRQYDDLQQKYEELVLYGQSGAEIKETPDAGDIEEMGGTLF